MYLKWTTEFIRYLNYKDHTIEEMLGHLVLRVFAPLNASSAFISKLNSQNSLTTVGRFGIPSEISENYNGTFLLSENVPITEAIRLHKTVVINTLPFWPDDYPLLSGVQYESSEKCFIAFPIEKSDTPVAVLGIFFSQEVVLNPSIELFLESIGHLLSMYLFPSAAVDPTQESSKGRSLLHLASNSQVALTDRQLLILRLISQGHTNSSIGELLKYSESTVRQETIKIFAKLQCVGREEASRIYVEQRLAANIA
jgi:DNA-binding CsgD family transcriptional regulator